jgi:hypothetical protein
VDALFETVLRVSAEDPVLWPFTTVNISLGIVVPYGLLFGNIVLIPYDACAFGWGQVGPKRRSTRI